MKNNKRVVITGIGPLASAGIGKDAFWKGILDKQTGLCQKEILIEGELWDKFYFHKLNGFDISNFGIEDDILNDIMTWKKGKEDRDLFYLLAAIKLAIDDSGISYDRDNNNVGLFLTVEHPGFEPFCEGLLKKIFSYLEKHPLGGEGFSKSQMFRHLYEGFVRNGYDLQTFMYLHHVAKAFGIHGYSMFNNNACASGLFALESAARQIRCGGSDIVLIASGDCADTMFKHMWFKEQGLYAEDGNMKPFSKNADGIVLGDGASALVLEELDHALKRNAHIYAEYIGGGFSLEGWKVTMPQIGSSSYQEAIRSALNNAMVNPEGIDLLVPHGVAIKVTDGYEAKAIIDVFGKNSDKPLISAFKPYVGHNLGGSAILESSILLLAMDSNLIPPTLNNESIEAKYNINLVDEAVEHRIDTAMKLSCGFAGYNAAAVFKKIH